MPASAGRNRKGKVAGEITGKGYCSTKNRYYFGLKLHASAFRRKQTVPFPESPVPGQASENGRAVFRENRGETTIKRTCFGDKIYVESFFYRENEKTNI